MRAPRKASAQFGHSLAGRCLSKLVCCSQWPENPLGRPAARPIRPPWRASRNLFGPPCNWSTLLALIHSLAYSARARARFICSDASPFIRTTRLPASERASKQVGELASWRVGELASERTTFNHAHDEPSGAQREPPAGHQVARRTGSAALGRVGRGLGEWPPVRLVPALESKEDNMAQWRRRYFSPASRTASRSIMFIIVGSGGPIPLRLAGFRSARSGGHFLARPARRRRQLLRAHSRHRDKKAGAAQVAFGPRFSRSQFRASQASQLGHSVRWPEARRRTRPRRRRKGGPSGNARHAPSRKPLDCLQNFWAQATSRVANCFLPPLWGSIFGPDSLACQPAGQPAGRSRRHSRARRRRKGGSAIFGKATKVGPTTIERSHLEHLNCLA